MLFDKLMFVFLVTLFLSIFLISIPTPETLAAFPGENGKIAFSSDRDGDYEIYIMNADGSNVTQLTSNSVDDWAPVWSPDGSKIAFTHEVDGDLEIYVMNSNGSDTTRLTNSSGVDDNPAWSSDGSQIAFDSERSGNYTEIYIMNIDGTNQTVITNNQSDYSPAWSPDGSRIAFYSDRDLNDEIYTMDPDGSNPQRLTNNSERDATPDWHPNGSKIVFASKRGTVFTTIYVMDADGSNQTKLTNNTNGDYTPTYSPDGMKIVFMRSDGNNTEIFLMNADGSNQTQLTNNTANDGWPSWQPTSGPTPPSAFTITFDTTPANMGTITFNGTSYNDGNTTSIDAGSYTITANVATNYTFIRWETEDSIYVSNSSSPTTNCSVSGNGTLRMVQNSTIPQQVTISFETEPANMGTITFDDNTYSNGENVSLQTGTYMITANPPSGYAFSAWETSISITVANSTASSTNCTINGMGTIRLVQTEVTTPPPTTPSVTPEPPPGCIIVTATLGSPMAPEVLYMRHVRDDLIGSNQVGKMLVAGWNTFYYSWSPPIAKSISKYEPLRSTVGILLTPLFGIVHSTAYTYNTIEPVNSVLASTISFLSAAIMSIAVYVAIPILGLGVLARRINLYMRGKN
jgi:Tol biopolymer transport system component